MDRGFSEELLALSSSSLILFFALFLFVVVLLALLIGFGWWWSARQGTQSPYGGGFMRRGSELEYSALEKVHHFWAGLDSMPNPPLDLKKAFICARTGRIFTAGLGKDFLYKRAGDWISGPLISWGSLDESQKSILKRMHESLDGFNTERSSRKRRPEHTEKEFWDLKPGPLYVNLSTACLVGWKCVPGTNLEVLVIQRPLCKPSNF